MLNPQENRKIVDRSPPYLTIPQVNEDTAWAESLREGSQVPAWVALVHKRDDIFYFQSTVLFTWALLGSGMGENILEVGAGSCWASSLVKSVYPKSYVVASDISMSALEKGLEVSKILSNVPDKFVVCSTEELPFADESFDIVFGNATLHHLENLPQALYHIRRVLKPGGRYLGSGELSSSIPLVKLWLGRREKALGILENYYSVGKWRKMFEEAGFRNIEITYNRDWEYRLYHWFPALYYKLLGYLPKFTLRWLPCGIIIEATK